MKKILLSLGHGYSARALTRHLPVQDWTVIGTTRSAEKAGRLREEGVTPLLWPVEDFGPALQQATHILASAAPDDTGDPFLSTLRPSLHRAQPKWVGYLSTTGVYGDHQGAWVDEDTPMTPTTRRGALRVMAEGQWQDAARDFGWPLHIFRLAGIYGPGRGPFEKVRGGTARRIVKPGQVFSRIHVEDIAQILTASMTAPTAGQIYNVCDDDPAPPQDVIAHAALLLGLPVPQDIPYADVEMTMTPMARSFYAENKRVRNDRIKNALGVKLIYPTYREGLAALLSQSAAPRTD